MSLARNKARILWSTVAAAALALPLVSSAGVLPDDRADALFHRYEGGGVTIQGPSILVRKKMAEKYAVSANYYQDMITSASIDVEVSGASEYKEERDQYCAGLRVPARQDHVQPQLHQQRRERLRGPDRAASA